MDNSALCYSDASFLDHTLYPIEERAGLKVKQRAPLSLSEIPLFCSVSSILIIYPLTLTATEGIIPPLP